MDTGNFGRFHPARIRLTDQGTTEKMFRRFDVGNALDDPKSAVDSLIEEGGKIAGNASDKIEDAKDDIVEKGSELIDEVGDKIGDVRKAIEQFITKVLATIETELNDWIRNVADELGNLDIAQKYSLHVMTFCKMSRGNFSSDNTEATIPGGETICTPFFGNHGRISFSFSFIDAFANTPLGDNFNETENDGKIVGFPPGKVIASVLDLFMIPKEVQEKVKEPVDNIANNIQHILDGARQTLKEGPAKLAFGPGFVLYLFACLSSWGLFLMLLAEIGRTWLRKEPFRQTKRILGALSKISILALFFANLITTLMGVIANLLNVAAQIFKVTIARGGGFHGITWGSFFIMIAVAIGLRGIHKPTARLSPLSANFTKFTGKLGAWRKGKRHEDQPDFEMERTRGRPTEYHPQDA